MKKIILISIFLISYSLAGAAELSVQEWSQLKEDLASFMADYADKIAAGEAPPIKCATPLISELKKMRPKMDVQDFLDRHDSLSFKWGTTNFRLHYTSTGNNAVYQFNEQNIIVGVPDYVVESGIIMEEVWAHTVGDLGFPPPLSDGSYANNGGDGRMDIYLVDIGAAYNAYGATIPEFLLNDSMANGYMLLDNDYQSVFPGYSGRPLDAVRVTGAHEFFHTIQFGMDIREVEGPPSNPAWAELSATYMEEEHYTDINDYYGYLSFFYSYPQWSLRAGTYLAGNLLNLNLHMYGSSVFLIYLTEKYGSGIVKDIWDGCRAKKGPNWWLAADDAIMAASSGTDGLRDAFFEFTLWNLFTKDWARAGSYFPEAENYEAIAVGVQVTSYPAMVTAVHDTLRPDELGSNYIMLENFSSSTDSLVVGFAPDRAYGWRLHVVGLPVDISDTGQSLYIDSGPYDSSTTQFFIPNISNYDRIALIPAAVGKRDISGQTFGTRLDYAFNVLPYEGERLYQPNGGEQLFVGVEYNITWYFDQTVDSVLIELSPDGGVNWTEIARAPNTFVYSWIIPNNVTASGMIRVSDIGVSGKSDQSDEVFGIGSVGENEIKDPYPNPVWIPRDAFVKFKSVISTNSLRSFDMTVNIMTLSGERIKKLYAPPKSGGAIFAEWDLTNENGETVAAGPYLAIIEFAGMTEVKKILVMR